jgi:hypothetical protein
MEHPMKKWNAIGILTVLVIGMVLMSGCTNTGSTGTVPEATPTPQIVNETVLVTPTQTLTISPNSTSAPVPVTNQTQSTQDPIIGSWLNGMVFNADGTVGSDGTTTWKVNKNENNSYFVIADVPSQGANNQRSLTSTEWRYNPFSDKINIRGSSQTFARGIPAPTPVPAVTTIQTLTTAVIFAAEDNPGTLTILTGGGLGSDVIVYIAREGSNVQPINTDPYTNSVANQNPGYIQVKILPSGETPTVSLAPGNYFAYLPSKSGGEPEQQSFTISANCNTVITFSGYSYRASSGGGCGG